MIKTILSAVDGSASAMRAVELAAELASQTGAGLHLVHVVPLERTPRPLKELARTEHIDNPDILELEAAANTVMKPARAHAEEWDCAVIETAVLHGEPVRETLDYARRHKADLIVAGRRGLGRLEGLLLGSFSAQLAQLAPCPVTIVK